MRQVRRGGAWAGACEPPSQEGESCPPFPGFCQGRRDIDERHGSSLQTHVLTHLLVGVRVSEGIRPALSRIEHVLEQAAVGPQKELVVADDVSRFDGQEWIAEITDLVSVVCLALQKFWKLWATDMAADGLDELLDSRFIGDAKGEKEPRQRESTRDLSAKRPGDTEADDAGEGREQVPLQIRARPRSELVELAFEPILRLDRRQWLEPLPDTLQIEQIDVGEVKG